MNNESHWDTIREEKRLLLEWVDICAVRNNLDMAEGAQRRYDKLYGPNGILQGVPDDWSVQRFAMTDVATSKYIGEEIRLRSPDE